MQSELEKGILRYVDNSIENAPYTQIYTGLVKASGVDGYTISLNGVEYANVPSKGTFLTNDTVRVVVPNNQYSNMFILSDSTGGSVTGAVSSVNGMTGDVVISNVASADKLSSAKTITLSGDATGSVSTDFSTNPTVSVTVVDDSHNHIISNVDNLQTTLNVKADLVDGKVPSSQLPSFVDDVLEYATLSVFPVTGTSGVIYVDLSTNLAYRWSGTVYVEISPSLALGETSSTAYRGDRGAIAYNHSLSTSNPHSTTASQVGLGNVDNTADATKNVLSATKLATARTISLTGDVTGSISFDGSANVSITSTVADDSHNHVISNVDNLQTSLDAKAPLSSPSLTGTPTAPTAISGTNTTQIATTAFVRTAVNTIAPSTDIYQISGTYTADSIQTLAIPTIVDNKISPLDVYILLEGFYNRAILGIDYTYKIASSTSIDINILTAGTYVINYGYYAIGYNESLIWRE